MLERAVARKSTLAIYIAVAIQEGLDLPNMESDIFLGSEKKG